MSHFLPQACRGETASVIYGKNRKMRIKSVKMNISKKKHAFLSHVPRIIQPKNYMLKGVLCSPITDTHTDTRKCIRRTPFHGFRNFSFNLSSRIGPTFILDIMWENTVPGTKFHRIFCAGIGPLQVGVVLVLVIL